MNNNKIDVDPHLDFVDGFNQGYFLAKEMPQFASDMAKYMPDDERGTGFGKGIEQYSRDLNIDSEKTLKGDFKENKGDLGIDKNSRDNLMKDFQATKNELGVNNKDRITDWLTDHGQNKRDILGEDRDQRDKGRDMDRGLREPEFD